MGYHYHKIITTLLTEYVHVTKKDFDRLTAEQKRKLIHNHQDTIKKLINRVILLIVIILQ